MGKYLYVNGDQYNNWFIDPTSDTEKLIIVDGHLWNEITSMLPENYKLPNPASLRILNKASAALDAPIQKE